MKKKRAYIRGIAGFAGSYLAQELLEAGYKVSGSLLENESRKNIEDLEADLDLVSLDILNLGNCQAVLHKMKPDVIFHLAAIASVGRSFDQESLTLAVNFQGTLNMLESARQLRRLDSFLFVSSADCYGLFTPQNKTLTEDQPLAPISPYGIAKAAAEQATLYYHRQHSLPAKVARSFNHSGPRQSDSFVIPDFARQIALIEHRLRKPLMRVGDLSAKRDFSDVRDIIKGYRLITEKAAPGEIFQLCSGKAVSIASILKKLLSLSENNIKVETDPKRLRKADLPVLRGSNSKAKRLLRFENRYSLRDTLKDTLDYWRTEIANS